MRPSTSLLRSAVALLLLGVPGLVGPAPATAAGTAHVRGVVTGPDGQPLDGVVVEASRYDAATGSWLRIGTSAFTAPGARGAYDLADLEPGTYRLVFRPAFDDALADEWWSASDDATDLVDADDVVVAGGADVVGKDVQLQVGARITGTMSVPDASAGFPQLTVRAYRLNRAGDGWELETSDARTRVDGDYALEGLRPGRYRVRFDAPWGLVSQYYGGSYDLESAAQIVVEGAAVLSGRDVTIAATSRVTGSVTAGGRPATGVHVTAWLFRDGAWIEDDRRLPWEGAFGTTDAGGRFEVPNVPPGRVRLELAAEDGSSYLREYWPDSPTLAGARDLTVVTGADTTGVRAEVARPPVVNRTRPRITGAARVGRRLHVTRGAWSPTGVTLRYRWLSAGRPIAGATSRSLTLRRAQLGTRIRVRVVAVAPGRAQDAVRTRPTSRVGPRAS